MSHNNEENKTEDLDINQENINQKEQQPVSGSISEHEEKAVAVVIEKLNQPFEAFNTLSYLKEFYPDSDPVFALRAMQIIENSEQIQKNKTVIDIRVIKELLSKEYVNFNEKVLESLENCCITDFMLRKAVPEILKDIPDDHLNILDVGGGPTIYQHIPLMGVADSITHSEYLESNRNEIKKWREGISDFSWRSFFDTFQAYLKSHPNISKAATQEVQDRFRQMAQEENTILENQLRGKIRDILPVDVFREDLGMGENEKRFDLVNVGREGSAQIITSNFCVESATADNNEWKRGIENITSRVPQGGFLLMTAIRNANWYKVGDERMNAVPVNAENLSAELKQQGFEIRNISELIGSEQEVVGYDGMVFILAKRITN